MTNQTHPFTYKHDDGRETFYDVQEVQHAGRPPVYIISEAADNKGPGLDDPGTKSAIAHDAATMMRGEHNLEAHQLNIYQQRPDGNFDRVDVRDIGRDVSMNPNQPTDWQECGRTPYSRKEVEQAVEVGVAAPEETHQQKQQQLQEQWNDLQGPSIDRKNPKL